MPSSIQGHLTSKIVSHARSYSIQRHLPFKVALHPKLLPSKIVFHPRSSSIQGCLPSKVIFNPRLSSIQGYLPSKVVFHLRLFSIQGWQKVLQSWHIGIDLLAISCQFKYFLVTKIQSYAIICRSASDKKVITSSNDHSRVNCSLGLVEVVPITSSWLQVLGCHSVWASTGSTWWSPH